MQSHPSVRRWAAVLRVLAILAMVAFCAALLFGVVSADLPADLREAAGIEPGRALAPLHRVATAAAGAIPSLALIYVLGEMARLFARYSRGEMLTEACARHILRIGSGLLASTLLELLSRPLQTLIASSANPPGARVIAVSLEGGDFGLVLAGGLMVMIGWSMREAALIAEENRSFV